MATMLVCGYTRVMEMSLAITLSVFFFILGTLIGSFLNVVILRYNTGKGLSGRSRCQSCLKTLSPVELIPVFSFLVQKGVCKVCHSRVSVQYPLVEFSTGVLFLLVFSTYSFIYPFTYISTLGLVLGLVVVSVLVIITVYDTKHGIIPNRFVYGFIALSLFVLFFDVHTFSLMQPDIGALLAGPLLALPVWFLWYISGGRWIGLGDAKLFLGVGWFLGVSEGLTAFALSFWIGAFVSLCLIALQKLMRIRKLNLDTKNLTIKTEIPFAPFIILSFFIVYFSGLNLITFITP